MIWNLKKDAGKLNAFWGKTSFLAIFLFLIIFWIFWFILMCLSTREIRRSSGFWLLFSVNSSTSELKVSKNKNLYVRKSLKIYYIFDYWTFALFTPFFLIIILSPNCYSESITVKVSKKPLWSAHPIDDSLLSFGKTLFSETIPHSTRHYICISMWRMCSGARHRFIRITVM